MTTDDDIDAAELALGVLEGAERAVAMRRMLAEPDFRAAVERWRAHFAGMFAAVPEVAPSAELEEQVVRPLRNGDGGSVAKWRWATALASLAAVVLLVALLLRPPAFAPPPVVAPEPARPALLASLAGETVKAPFGAVYTSDGRIAIAEPPPVPEGRSAELWAIGGDGVPHALGVIEAAGALPVTREDRARLIAGATLAVSVEPPGGSPTGKPTGPVIATGVLVRA